MKKFKKLRNFIFIMALSILGVFALNDNKVNAETFGSTLIQTEIEYNTGTQYCSDDETKCLRFYGENGNYIVEIERLDLKRSYIYYGATYNSATFTLTSSYYRYIRWSDNYVYNETSSDRSFVFFNGEDGWHVISSFDNVNVHFYAENEYDEGYSAGFDSGLIEGQHRGYDTGYTEGFDDGYSVGFDENNNTLVGMVGAIFTGPVTMLTSVFNFEFLGINLVPFILSFLTLLVVIWLIKRFI